MGTCAFHLVVLIWYRLKLRFSSSSYHIHSSMVSVKLPLFFSSVNVQGLIKSMTFFEVILHGGYLLFHLSCDLRLVPGFTHLTPTLLQDSPLPYFVHFLKWIC